MSAEPEKKTRAEINRENAQKSTGPKSKEGKAASSKNAFKHGFYSNEVVIPGEDPALYEELLADLRSEHQPATPTEEILVEEIAQHFWHMRRWRKFETQMYAGQGAPLPDSEQPLDTTHLLNCVNSGLFSVLQRSLASAERSFHRALSSLMRLKKQNGFVPSEPHASAGGMTTRSASHGFVPGKRFSARSRVDSFDGILPEFPWPTVTKAPEPPVSS